MSGEYVLKRHEKHQSNCLILLSLVVLTLLILDFITISTTHAGEATLKWDASADTNLAGYKLYYGKLSRSYEYSVDVGKTTTYTLTDLSDGDIYYFAATAYDVYGNESSFSEEIAYAVNNKPPVAEAGPDQNIPAGHSVILSAANSYDPDGGIISYVWTQTQGTAVALSDSNAVVPSFVAPYIGPTGEALKFTLTVTDGYGVQSVDTCSVNVVAENLPPVADAGPEQTVQEWAVVMLDGSKSTDPGDGVAAYAWEQIGGPSVELHDADLAQPTFVAPDVEQEGVSLVFQMTVMDLSGLQSVDTCVVNVAWVNLPPVAKAGPNKYVKTGTTVTLDGTASTDPDDGIASYHWRQISGPPIVLSDPSASKPLFTAPTVFSSEVVLGFSLTVTDKSGLMSRKDCTVTVRR